MSTPTGPASGERPSFLDFLLAGDVTGELKAVVDADAADLAAGKKWGVYDGDRCIGVHPARFMAESDAADAADAADRPVSDYSIREIPPEAAGRAGGQDLRNRVAAVIRRVDGTHTMGAAGLADAIVDDLEAAGIIAGLAED